MAKLTKDTLFKPVQRGPETLMDKTTRAVRTILDEEAEVRNTRTERLRKARLARDAATPVEEPKTKSGTARKTTRKKAAADGGNDAK